VIANFTLTPVVGRTPDVPSAVRMYPAGESIYIAFCDDCSHPHYLEVAGTLYVFLQDGLNCDGVISALSSVIDRLPSDSIHVGCTIDTLIEPAWIAQYVATELNNDGHLQAVSSEVRRDV